MKKYNVKNYVRYKEDVKRAIKSIPSKSFIDYTPKELKIIFLPLVENIGRKFATSQEASGVMSINDIIQEGSLQLCKAVDKIDRLRLMQSEDIEMTLKSFLAKKDTNKASRITDGTYHITDFNWNPNNKTIVFSHTIEPTINSQFVSGDISVVNIKTKTVPVISPIKN